MNEQVITFPTTQVAKAASFIQPFRGRIDLSEPGLNFFLDQIKIQGIDLSTFFATIKFLQDHAWLLALDEPNCWELHPLLKNEIEPTKAAQSVYFLYIDFISNYWIEQAEKGLSIGNSESFTLKNRANLEKAVEIGLDCGFRIEKPLSLLDALDKQSGDHKQRIARLVTIVERIEQEALPFKNIEEQIEYTACLDLLANAYHQAGQLERAERMYTTVLAFTEGSEVYLLELAQLNALTHLISILREKRSWTQGKVLVEKAEQLSIKLADSETLTQVYWTIGLWHKEQYHLNEANTYLYKSFQSAKDSFEKGMILVNLAALADDEGQTLEALMKNLEALEFFKNHLSIAPVGKIYNNIGLLHEKLGSLADAIHSVRRALEWCLIQNDEWGMAECYQNLATFHFTERKLDEADEYYQRALEVYQRLGSVIAIAEIYQNRGEIYRLRGNLEQAVQYAESAVNLYQQLEDPIRTANTLINLGSALMQSGKGEQAWAKWLAAEESLQKTGNHEIGLGLIARNRAEWLRRNKNDSQSALYLNQAADYFGKTQAKNEAAELIAYTNLFVNLTGNRTPLESVAQILNQYFDEDIMYQLLDYAGKIYQRLA